MVKNKPGLPPPEVDWNDMKPGQIAWHVTRKPGGWEVSRVYGPDSLLDDTERPS